MTNGKKDIDDETMTVNFTLRQLRLIGNALLVTADPQGRILGEKVLKFYRQEHDRRTKSMIERIWGMK